MVSAVSVLLTCVPYAVIARIGTSVLAPERAFMAVVMAALWLVICIYDPNQYLVGMESALHAAVIWTIVLQFLRIQRQARTGGVRRADLLLFALLLVLNVWTRLDSAGLSMAFLALLLITTHRQSAMWMEVGVPAALVAAAGAATLFSFFYFAGGSFLPVSALVKGYRVDRFSLGAFYNWSLVLLPIRIPGANLLNVLGILSWIGSVVALARMQAAAEAQRWAPLRLAALGLAAGVLVHSVITFGMFHYYYFWYLSASFAYWAIAITILAMEGAARHGWKYDRMAWGSALCAVSLACFWAATTPPNNLATTRYEASRWIDANVRSDALLAAFNAGQLGYFSNRSVVNLDGLINNVSYFEAVLKRESPEPLGAYLDRLGVDYVVDYQLGRFREVIERRYRTVQEFKLASGSSIKIMARIPTRP
jgi:hypothetical protein